MVLDDIGEFIRRQRESLEVEKRDFHKEVSQESVRKRISCNVQEPDQNVPTIGLSPEPKHVYDAEPEEEEEATATNTMFPWNSNGRSPHLERRAVTAGEQPQQSSVGESFYSYFPSFNSAKQRKLEETRKEYFEYLRKVGNSTSPKPATTEDARTTTTAAVLDNCCDDPDERRRMEKERLAAQFQKSNRKSILNYQIVEERNKSVEEEAARKKQEYHDALMQQIEDQKRRLEAKKAREKLDDEIMNRKIELLDVLDREKELHGQQSQRQKEQLVQKQQPKAASDTGIEEVEDSPRFRERKLSYNYFSNSARDSGPRDLVVRTGTTDELPPQAVVDPNNHKPCCEHYKLILDKLETLCRWRDDFVAKKKGCLLCDSGNLKNCNFCDYHGAIVQGNDALEYDDSSDSEAESMKFSSVSIRKPGKKGFKMIRESLADKPTPQLVVYSQKDHGERKGLEKRPETNEKRNSFINFDDIPLPAPRGAALPPTQLTKTRVEEDVWTSRSKLRLNEMKRVEWKWNIPAVQTHNITKDKPEKVLTQLGAIRKQLQMEQLQIE